MKVYQVTPANSAKITASNIQAPVKTPEELVISKLEANKQFKEIKEETKKKIENFDALYLEGKLTEKELKTAKFGAKVEQHVRQFLVANKANCPTKNMPYNVKYFA